MKISRAKTDVINPIIENLIGTYASIIKHYLFFTLKPLRGFKNYTVNEFYNCATSMMLF